MNVSENLKRIRKEKGLTQKQLGELCSPPIAESTIRRYELGKLNPKLETVQKIADALQVEFTQILAIDDDEDFDKDLKDIGHLAKLADSDTFSLLKALSRIDKTMRKLGFSNINEVFETTTGSPLGFFAPDSDFSSLTDDDLHEIANFIDYVVDKRKTKAEQTLPQTNPPITDR